MCRRKREQRCFAVLDENGRKTGEKAEERFSAFFALIFTFTPLLLPRIYLRFTFGRFYFLHSGNKIISVIAQKNLYAAGEISAAENN